MKKNFNEWIKTFTLGIYGYDYYTDFEKVYENVNKFKVELNILNSLIGSNNIKEEFVQIIHDYPKTVKCIPLLLAVRSKTLQVTTGNGSVYFNFKKKGGNVDDYVTLMEKTGLFDLMQNKLIASLVDYVTGVEVGLDSNGRKNRGGNLMGSIVKEHLEKTGLVENENLFCDMYISDIEQKFNIDLSAVSKQSKAAKRIDFVVKKGDVIYAIKTNFYSSGGSKLNETAVNNTAMSVASKNMDNFNFIWVTDGKGWKLAKHNLEEAYTHMNHIYCLADLENGAFDKLFK